MLTLFATGHIVDLILAFTVVEAVLVIALHRRTGRGPSPADLLSNLLSGVCLMLALRGALVDPVVGIGLEFDPLPLALASTLTAR